MMTPLYSIIIPHYNIPELLVRCLKSIPVREDIQVIVVDDCSPNADTYKERFPEFFRPFLEWYSTPQGGSAGRARNIGLEHAKGKWVMFLDADDYFTPAFETLVDKYAPTKYDVIHFKEDSINEVTKLQSNRHIDRNSSIDAYLKGYVSAKEAALWHTTTVAQMISRQFIEDHHIRCDEVVVANDVMFAAQLACLSNKVHFSNDILYVVTTRENSLHDSKQKDPARYVVQHKVELNFHRYISKHGVKRTPPCMLKIIQKSYRTWGIKAACITAMMVLREHALLYGLGEYIKRHI